MKRRRIMRFRTKAEVLAYTLPRRNARLNAEYDLAFAKAMIETRSRMLDHLDLSQAPGDGS